MLSIMFLVGCSGETTMSVNPDFERLYELNQEFDSREMSLEIRSLKEKYKVGNIKTVKVWTTEDQSKGEISYVPLLDGEKEIAILLSETTKDIDDLDRFKEKAEDRYTKIMDVGISKIPFDLDLVEAIADGEFVGIDFVECVDSTMDALWSIAKEEIKGNCEQFRSPDKSWAEYRRQNEIENTDVYSKYSSEEETIAQEAYKKYLEGMTIEQYIEITRLKPSSSCLELKLLENNYYKFKGYSTAISTCVDYTSRAKDFVLNRGSTR